MPSSLLSTSLTRHSSMGRACAESGGVLLSSWQKKRRSQRIWPVRSSAPTCTCTWLQRVATQTQHVAAQRVTSLNLWQRSHWRIRNTAVMVLNSSQTHTARASTSPVWEGVTQAAVEDRRSNGALGKPENAELKTMSLVPPQLLSVVCLSGLVLAINPAALCTTEALTFINVVTVVAIRISTAGCAVHGLDLYCWYRQLYSPVATPLFGNFFKPQKNARAVPSSVWHGWRDGNPKERFDMLLSPVKA